MDHFTLDFHVLIPVLFCIGGIGGLLTAVVGSPKHYNRSGKRRSGKGSRLLDALGSLLLLGFGLFLLYTLLFGPIRL